MRPAPAIRLMLAALVAASVGCRPALPHASASIDSLAREVLSALEQRDAARLRELALSEAEFRDVIWPELPAARPERNLTAEYVWNDTRGKSETGLHAIVAEHGGRPLELVRVEFRGETTQHRTFLVRRDPVAVVRGAGGAERALRLFGSVVERDGAYKVFSYNVD